MNQTRNNRPRTYPTSEAGSLDKENKAPRTVAAPGRPSGQHSPLAREAVAQNFLSKTEKSIKEGQQTADALLKDPAGLEAVKHRLLSAGLVLEHNQDKKTMSAVSATKFFSPGALAKYSPPSQETIVRELKKNANYVRDRLGAKIEEAVAKEKAIRLDSDEIETATYARVIHTIFFAQPSELGCKLGTNSALQNLAVTAANHIGVSLVHVPDRDVPMPLVLRDELSNPQ